MKGNRIRKRGRRKLERGETRGSDGGMFAALLAVCGSGVSLLHKGAHHQSVYAACSLRLGAGVVLRVSGCYFCFIGADEARAASFVAAV